jgi:hypothetical protein
MPDVEAYIEEVEVYNAILNTHGPGWVVFEKRTGAALSPGMKTREKAEKLARKYGFVLVEKE